MKNRKGKKAEKAIAFAAFSWNQEKIAVKERSFGCFLS